MNQTGADTREDTQDVTHAQTNLIQGSDDAEYVLADENYEAGKKAFHHGNYREAILKLGEAKLLAGESYRNTAHYLQEAQDCVVCDTS